MEKELKRLQELLPTLNPASEDYSRVLQNIISLDDYIQYHQNRTFAYEPKHQDEPKVVIEPQVQVEPTPVAIPIPTPVVTKVTTDQPQTKEEVRALLSAASKSGVQIQPIIAKFVPEGKPIKFSEIPDSCYQDLVKEIKNAR